jgi:hypothetical protein
LAEIGVCYPGSLGQPNNIRLPVAAMADNKNGMYLRQLHGIGTDAELKKFRVNMEKEFSREIEKYHAVIISNEHCSSNLILDSEVEWVKKFLDRYSDDVKVIIYLRKQSEYLLSTYSTQIRLGAKHKLGVLNEDIVERRYNYKPIVDRWSNFFGDVSIRKYDLDYLKGNDIVLDIFDIIGIDVESGFPRKESENKSLGRDQIEFMRRFNRYLPLYENKILSNARGDIDKIVDQVEQTGGKVSLPKGFEARFMERFYESNGYIADKYFGRREEVGDPLFGQAGDFGEGYQDEKFDLEKSFKIFKDILLAKIDGKNSKTDMLQVEETIFSGFAEMWRSFNNTKK